MWEQAEVTVVSRVISVMLPDLQELTPIHSSNCLSAGKGTHRETNAHKKNTHTFGPLLAPQLGFPQRKTFSIFSINFSVSEKGDISNIDRNSQLTGQFVLSNEKYPK